MFTHNPAVKLRLFAHFVLSFLGLLLSSATAWSLPPPAPVLRAPGPGTAFRGTLELVDLDTQAFAEWADGKETLIGTENRERSVQWVLWTKSSVPGHSGVFFGLSGNPGVRHLRIGFTRPVATGTVMVNGGGVLSVLKPAIPYPGDLNNDAHWQPAQRLLRDGRMSSDPVASGELAFWLLPAGTNTRALRFTHIAQPTDAKFQGWLGGALVTEERMVNQGVYATVSSKSADQYASRLNNGMHDGWGAWSNREKNKGASETEPVISTTHAEWMLMSWPAPVKLGGVATLWTGFTAAEVQTYIGPANRHPRDALDRDWQSIAAFEGIQHGYPKPLWPNRLDFGREITTRALRVRVTAAAAPEPKGHHLHGNDLDGRRIWIGELMALQSIGSSQLKALAPPVTVQVAPRPPIPVKFTLKQPGYVTLVIERPDGVRVRNLVSETLFPAGENIAWWDGTDDLGRDIDAAKHGIYRIPARFVEPGEYRVRGLVRSEVKPVYEFSVYTTGNPPWDTADHTGAWLANHSPPSAAAFVPAAQSPTGEPVVYLGCYVTEGPDGLAWVDLDGRKRGGKKWIGGNWTAAPYLARDGGPRAVSGVHVYAASVWSMDRGSAEFELRVTALTASGDTPVLVKPLGELIGNAPATGGKLDSESRIGGLAVYDAVIAVSLTAHNQLVVIRAADSTVIGRLELPSPRGLSFDAQGRLHVLSGNRLVRFDSITAPTQSGSGKLLVGSGLESPVGLTLDETGRLYVSDGGKSHQVKVFAPDGKFIRAIGKAGAPKAGPYDPLRMQKPSGIAIDSKHQLWVTEADYLPKRVSVWSLDGKLINAFYGPGKYGGGGALDSTDKTKFYYADEGHGAMEFRLDWTKGAYELAQVYYRPAPGDLKLGFRSAGPETALYHQGRRYFTNCYNTSPTSGTGTAFLFAERDGIACPVAAMGRAGEWDVLKADAFRPLWPEGVDLTAKNQQGQAFFIWNDLNADAQVQPGEVVFDKGDASGVTVTDNLAFCIARLNGKTTRFAPASIDAQGNPRYDLARAEVLASGVFGPPSSGGNQALAADDGWTALTLGLAPFSSHSVSGAKDGVAKWSYPNLWPGLHASHEAPPPDHPGQLIGPTRLLCGLMKSRIGPIWAVNSNHGCFYVFTSDGLFVATVFEDMRQGKRWHMPVATRGMSLEGLTLNDENFWPTITQLPDGTVYLVDGGRSSLVRIDGLDTLSRLPDAPLTITREDLDRSRAWLIETEAARQRVQGSGVLTVAGRFKPPVLDGKLDDWPSTNWVDIDKRGVRAYFNSNTQPYDVTGTVAVAGGRLYAAWRTGNPKLLNNSGEMPIAPFKTGGALDLMIGANPNADPDRRVPVVGDVRVLVTRIGGKHRALLYRAVVPGTAETARVPFSSPWRTITFDRVDDITGQVEFAAAEGNYEISVPLELLLLRPAADMIIKGDIGILRGEGGQTTVRVYWANKATGITADVPSEAMLTPNLWGSWRFKPE